MDLESRLKQTQQLNLSQDIQLSLKILEMSNLEINNYIENLFNTNPFLKKIGLKENSFTKSYSSNDSGSEFFENQSKEKDLLTYLEEQITLEFKEEDIKVARYLCDFLDEKGYFKGDINHISLLLKCNPDYIGNILKKLKNLDPIGIFAETIPECLRIQLKDKGLLSTELEIILENLELVAGVEINKLAKLARISVDEVMGKINLIKQLNPKPASCFSTEPAITIIPDLILNLSDNEFELELNHEILPKISFREAYYKSLKMEIKDKEGKNYLTQSSKEIMDVIRHLKQRSNSLILVAREIVNEQIEFFTKGIKYFKPLTIHFIGEKLNLHSSTISRVTKNKYISTPIGIFELKHFFTKGIDNGKEINSNKTIKHEILEIINNEPINNPFSDDKIVLILKDKGYKISRRTVTKYRESLNISNSNQRKKQKLLKNI